MAITRLTQIAAQTAAQSVHERLGIKPAAPAGKEEQQKADYWLNVGYETQDPQYPFISLPLGIPLDNLTPTPLRGSNQDYLEFVGAKNQLLELVMAKASTLQPGEETIVNLQVQIRRVKAAEDVAAPNTGKFTAPSL